jgi:hypothetical protein
VVLKHYKAKVTKYKMQAKASKLRADDFQEQKTLLQDRLDEITTHAILAARHIHALQAKLNSKVDKRGHHRVVHIGSRIISTQEGRAEAAKQKAAREVKAQKAEESQRRKDKAKADMRTRRAQEGRLGMMFTGTLSTQRRTALQDIAWTLGLSEDGTRDDLITRIKAFFDKEENRHLFEDQRYSGLFTKRLSKRPLATMSADNVPEITSHQHLRLNDAPSFPYPFHFKIGSNSQLQPEHRPFPLPFPQTFGYRPC